MGKVILGVVLFVLLIIGLTFVSNEFEIFGTRFWGVRQENARREVFEQSQSYVEGKRQELSKLELEYKTEKDPDAKEALRQSILQRFANFDDTKLDNQSYQFLQSLRR